MFAGSRWLRQFSVYGVVGVVSNAILFALYLLFTALGMEPKTAMTVLYAAGVLQTFVFNRRWTFAHDGRSGPALVRYIVAYALGYGLNLAGLYVLVDLAGWPHALVQGGMIAVVAVFLFVLQRYWVFTESPGVLTSR